MRKGRSPGPVSAIRYRSKRSTQAYRPRARVKDLKEALASSDFEPEKVNIKAAIDAYESGEVGYTKDYALIWAGQVVDTATTYGEFCVDQAERLDRYAEKYGPHWLWWDDPLDIHPSAQL